MATDFEPKVLAFCCNWCAYAGADLAGTSRAQYPANLRVIRVMCTGMVHPSLVIEALTHGADGVLVLGCHPGDCHYLEGNYKCLRRHHMLTATLEQFGVPAERVHLEWVSASEGDHFAKLADRFTARIRELGPLDWRRQRLAADGRV